MELSLSISISTRRHAVGARDRAARPLLTPGEVMQLPPDDEPVLVSGCHPIRAKKARYFEDAELQARILPPPTLSQPGAAAANEPLPSPPPAGDWTGAVAAPPASATDDPANAGIRREPELPEHENIAPDPAKPIREFEPPEEENDDDDAQRPRVLQRSAQALARQVTLDPADDMQM
jgi:type IV secretion system protein VirD4